MPSMSAAISSQVRVTLDRTPAAAKPMIATARTPTTPNRMIGPQLRRLPTRTGATGFRVLPFAPRDWVFPPRRDVLVLMGASPDRSGVVGRAAGVVELPTAVRLSLSPDRRGQW